MKIKVLCSDNMGDNSELTIISNEWYSVQRRDPVNWRSWLLTEYRGEEIKLHDKVLHEKQWKKITRVPLTQAELNEGQGRR